ncbi:ABC transporter substrate-binding protein [Paenarthrobacter sp. PH39-S1]|uniref:ABC transporter substrate-binding protein n=1 Tax=Paenarthrobacter sp. PH39-S1 TaxID=3046204 RepID=UPI0024B8D4E9|nr:ABC transporter substrate-binding protein [Paenarthrobacter sp. PH39-S1]MDJ0355080.1 ABC transporter substrate-binding protein [Paenarthrobacter sp. PH39-S1]
MPLSSKLMVRMTAVAAVAALALTGCTTASQNNAGAQSGASGSSSFDPGAVQKDDALAAAVPAALKSKGTITVGSDTSYAPAEFLGGSDGQTPQGYDVDFAKAIGATLGMPVKVQTAEFTGIIPALGAKYDLGISSFTINAERLQAVNMVSYFNAGTLWAVQKGNPKKFSLDDVCGKTIGVQTGTVEEDPDVSGRSAKCVADGKAAINIVTLKAQTDVTTRLVNGSIDAMSADSPIIGYALSQTGDKLEVLGDVYDSAPQGIITLKSDTALADLIGKVMNKLIDDGDYKKILDTWNNSKGAITKSEVNPAVGS